MGMRSSAYLHVRPFNNEAAQRVKEIDISEYNLYDGWEEEKDGLLYSITSDDLAYGRNNFDELMEKIKAALQDDGMAYLVELCKEDVPSGWTYFYLGDAIRYVVFEDLYEDEDEDEELDCEDDMFVPKLNWKESMVLGEEEEIKLTDREKDILKNHSW